MKEIPRYPGYYCDEEGGIWSMKTGELRPMKKRVARTGYEMIALKVGSTYRYPLVHRLVLQTFVGEGLGLDCNHKNGIRTDNRLANLEWSTRLENERHARRELGKLLHGEHHPVSKVTADDVRTIRQMRAEGATYKAIGERFGIGISQTARICNRKKWAHVE